MCFHFEGFFAKASVFCEWCEAACEAHEECPCRYACYLLFSLKTHNQAFENHDDDDDDKEEGEEDGEDKHEEVPVLSLSGAFLMLSSITVMVAVSSE